MTDTLLTTLWRPVLSVVGYSKKIPTSLLSCVPDTTRSAITTLKYTPPPYEKTNHIRTNHTCNVPHTH